MLYSKSFGGFIDINIFSGNIPEDVIEISVKEYQSALKRRCIDTLDVIDGKLVIVPAPSLTVAESLAAAKSAKASKLSAACAKAITGGFTSSALGAAHIYPSDQTDQANLNANVVSSLLPNLPVNWVTPQLCCDRAGVWTYRLHTVAQIQQVGIDGKAAVLAQLSRHAALRAELQATASIEEVAAIVWEA